MHKQSYRYKLGSSNITNSTNNNINLNIKITNCATDDLQLGVV